MTYLVINDYFSTHVLSEDTWSREVKDGCLYTKRILTKTNRVPKWGERYVHIVSFEIRFKKKRQLWRLEFILLSKDFTETHETFTKDTHRLQTDKV